MAPHHDDLDMKYLKEEHKPWHISCVHCRRPVWWLSVIYIAIGVAISATVLDYLPKSTDLLMMVRGRTPCVSYELRTNQNPKPMIPISCDYMWGIDAEKESKNYAEWRKINPDLPAMDVYPIAPK